jgi:non-structural maintenance of chromosomes element 4
MSDIEMDDAPRAKGLAYDPEQDPEEKRKVRKSYRTLDKKLEGL